MPIVKNVSQEQVRTDMPDFKVGSTVKVHQRVIDIIEDPKTKKVTRKERVQIFEGLVIAKKGGSGVNGSFMVRKIASGVGVERIYPLHSPNIVKLEVVKQPIVSKAKLYYVRERLDNQPNVRKNKEYKAKAKK